MADGENYPRLALSEIVVLSHRFYLNTITWESPVFISFTSSVFSRVIHQVV